MKFIIWMIIVFTLQFNEYNAEQVDCGNVKCDVGDSFLYHRYCCKDSRGQDDCCKKVRWKPVVITVCVIIGVLILIWILSCVFGLCKCLVNCLCCCFKKN
ncbi:hypothetical protein EWB00_002408 [Schistosoma japonicum]|uniref:SJCHGC04318 protein n=1 Tax=Schistosoma japonicum TaxID=6182 RepID=Q5DH59_SCHJA|nr:SJCHGC04318 protein [Schistosoma japonicum]TNN14172.1 hypothetical protein EWB00_002408 [Schistosoma japonicum]